MQDLRLPHDHGAHGTLGALQKELGTPERFGAAAEVFSLLSDATRLKIFWLLCHREECVINLSAWLGTSSPAASHHLRLLKECGLITSRRDGKEVYYRAADTEEAGLLHRVMEEMTEISCPKKTSPAGEGNTAAEVAEKAHEYLVTHLSERLTIEEMAHRFHINPTTLKAAFRKEYGGSLGAHVREHRMEEAARLLRETSLSVAEIAAAVGYGNQSKFTVAFKSSFGKTPTEYRK